MNRWRIRMKPRTASPRQQALSTGALIVLLVAVLWVMLVTLPRWYDAKVERTRQAALDAADRAPSGTPAAAPAGRRIKARLFFVAADGMHLSSIERDVPYGESATDQAREIITAQIAAPDQGQVSAVPAGTKLRALFITDRGEAYVDFTREIASAHAGGTADELLTVYTIVNALTANLPAVSRVQLLVEGKEVETLAGHVDLRTPLGRNLDFVR